VSQLLGEWRPVTSADTWASTVPATFAVLDAAIQQALQHATTASSATDISKYAEALSRLLSTRSQLADASASQASLAALVEEAATAVQALLNHAQEHPQMDQLEQQLDQLRDLVQLAKAQTSTTFVWRDSPLVEALRDGHMVSQQAWQA
jgi:hypothetical protein